VTDKDLVKISKADNLAERYAALPTDDASDIEKLVRIAGLVPMALEVVDEARDTIERLNRENEELRRELGRRD
jgi:hypothetical protein